jgi:pimeloyl-ACP methyl ester carboxylesterase
MEQSIRFCNGAAGTSIACATAGSGPPLLCSAWWLSHVQLDWEQPEYRKFFSALAERHTVIRYDRPGVGLSDRSHPDFTLESEVANLEAVADHHGLDSFALIGGSLGAPPAIAFAADHPDRITHLVIYGGFAAGSKLAKPELQSALVALVRANWGMGSKALTDLFAPGLSPELSDGFAKLQRAGCSPDTAARLIELMYRYDVEEAARRVRVPTLIAHRRTDHAIPFEMARQLAALIPTAELVTLDGNAHMPWYGDAQPVIDATLRFLGGGSPGGPAREEGSTNVFVRNGEVWTVRFGGTTVHLKHSKGLADLAQLIARPGADLEAIALAAGGFTERRTTAADEPVLDRRALASYRARLRELEEGLEAAESRDDVRQHERLEAERQVLLDELRKATGLGGRTRRMADDAERARKAVTGRIRQAIAAIHAAHPALGEHFQGCVATGTYCSYCPKASTNWET